MALLNSYPLILDKELAVVLGLNQALVLQQIHYWLEKNKKEGRNFHKGKYWTYNTMDQWQEEFPFWSKSTLKRVFKSLRDMKILEVDNFNSYQMDRTLWYTINYRQLEKLVEEYTKSHGAKAGACNGPKRENPRGQNRPKDPINSKPTIPENSTETCSEIYNQSICPSKETWTDGLDYKQIIENCELYAIDEKYRRAVAHAIRLLVLDVEKNARVRVGSNYIPAPIVKKDMEKLNFFTVEYAVNKFKEISSSQEIKNPVAYLKTLIYNSINEMEINIEADLRYAGLM